MITEYVDIAFDEARRGNIHRFVFLLIDVADRSVHSKQGREELDSYVSLKLEQSNLQIRTRPDE